MDARAPGTGRRRRRRARRASGGSRSSRHARRRVANCRPLRRTRRSCRDRRAAAAGTGTFTASRYPPRPSHRCPEEWRSSRPARARPHHLAAGRVVRVVREGRSAGGGAGVCVWWWWLENLTGISVYGWRECTFYNCTISYLNNSFVPSYDGALLGIIFLEILLIRRRGRHVPASSRTLRRRRRGLRLPGTLRPPQLLRRQEVNLRRDLTAPPRRLRSSHCRLAMLAWLGILAAHPPTPRGAGSGVIGPVANWSAHAADVGVLQRRRPLRVRLQTNHQSMRVIARGDAGVHRRGEARRRALAREPRERVGCE